LDAGYEVEVVDERENIDITFPICDENLLAHITWPPNHERAGQPIMLRDYQVQAINMFFDNINSVAQISTGAGKCCNKTTELSLCITDNNFKSFLENKLHN
jgi:superfamily II DNA or RNA helicase